MSYLKLIAVGRLGADPELRFTKDGLPVATARIATNRRWKDKASGEKREETTWLKVTVWGPSAEAFNEYAHKGDAVLVECDRIEASPYAAKDGTPAASLEATATQWQFVGRKPEGAPGQSVEIPF